MNKNDPLENATTARIAPKTARLLERKKSEFGEKHMDAVIIYLIEFHDVVGNPGETADDFLDRE